MAEIATLVGEWRLSHTFCKGTQQGGGGGFLFFSTPTYSLFRGGKPFLSRQYDRIKN